MMRGRVKSLSLTLDRYGLGLHPKQWCIPPIEKMPAVVEFAQSLGGKLALFALFALPLRFVSSHLWMWMMAAAALVSLAREYRHFTALLATGILLVLAPDWFDYRAVYAVANQEGIYNALPLGLLRAATLITCVPLVVAALWLARHYREHPLGRRPVLVQHLVFLCLLCLAASNDLHGVPRLAAWSLTTVFAAYFWYLAYALIDQRHKNPSGLVLQLATFHPFFGSTATPMAKGAANWRSVEAQSEEELAVTQLKGLKLITWAFCLKVVLWVFRKVVYGKLGITPVMISFNQFITEGISPGMGGGLSIIASYFEELLVLAIWGHGIIATARLAGFRLLRNTWRPLASRSIAEFWNRYFYYFKEILVNIYFYPTYLRCFKRHPRLRIAFATFMAAGFGNLLFHFMLENHRIPYNGLLETIVHMQTYAFYCAVLVCGIVISQLRNKRPDPNAGWFRRQFIPSATVASFYCFISFFDGADTSAELSKHFAYLFHVLGVY